MANTFFDDSKGRRYVVVIPDTCPICHHIVSIGNPLAKSWLDDTTYQVVFQCPFQGCNGYFIAYYEVIAQGEKLNELELKGTQPVKIVVENLPDTIREISPSFVSVYTEAIEAKQRGLLQIAGPGFRKAFEFLIKDYAKREAPEEEHMAIEQSFSGTVVANYIADPRIQAVAKRALWLANDETHYLRKWQQHDIDDLVTLIKLSIRWIEMEQLSAKYVKGMPDE